MSSNRSAKYRRRSYSNSESTFSPSSAQRLDLDHARKVATKRHRSAYLGFSSPPQKWDVERWRRGKRTRRDVSSSSDSLDTVECAFHSGGHSLNTCSVPSTPLASNSADFQLFPRKHDNTPVNSSAGASSPGRDNLIRLRSDAFWELRQSIAEGDETFVGRMRDFEDSRSRSGIYSGTEGTQRRGRKRPPPSYHTQEDDEDEDDIQIFAGTTADSGSWSPRKKRALSLGEMDIDPHFDNQDRSTFNSEGCSSPGATYDPESSPSFSEGADLPSLDTIHQFPFDLSSTVPPMDSSPALSHTFSSSSNSSIVSLPLSSHPFSIQTNHISSRRIIPMPSSRSEKAIAALTLAMANGAGGMSDYEAIRALQVPSAMEDCQVGELWN